MDRIKSAISAVFMTPWFIKSSWRYITTKSFRSKVEFFRGVVPALFRFAILTYNDYRKSIGEG